MLAPGATIGILGGGQLGRMTTIAAARLGYRTHIYCPEPSGPAGLVTPFGGFLDSVIDRYAELAVRGQRHRGAAFAQHCD